MANNKVIFDCDEILAAVSAADGDLGKVFQIDDERVRDGSKGVKYANLVCTAGGKKGRLNVRVLGEKHAGRIAPLDAADCAKINAEVGEKFGTVTPRDRHPSLNFQKWPVKIETDDKGAPLGELPPEDESSKFFRVCKHVNTFFTAHMQARKKAGMLVPRDDADDDTPEGALLVTSTRIVPLVQEKVGASAKSNAGAPLANPIVRINVKFDEKSGAPARGLKILDKTKPIAGTRDFEPLTFDDKPVTARNVHNIKSRTIANGIVDMGSVCYSQMGVSVPRDASILILEPAVDTSVSAGDVFGEEPAAAASASAAAGPTGDSDGDLDDALAGLEE